MKTKIVTSDSLKLKEVSQYSCEGCFYRKPSICPAERRRECSKQARERKYFIFVEDKPNKLKILFNMILGK